jgi:hypothetical protein
MLGRHIGPGMTPDVTMFTDLFRIVSEHGLAVPPEIAAVFRALATMEGTLTALAPGFDIVAEARRFAAGQLAAQFSPDVLRKTAADELIALLPTLRRLPRRIDRIGGALEAGRLSVNVRLLADPADRRYLTGLLHQVILVALAATSGVMASYSSSAPTLDDMRKQPGGSSQEPATDKEPRQAEGLQPGLPPGQRLCGSPSSSRRLNSAIIGDLVASWSPAGSGEARG